MDEELVSPPVVAERVEPPVVEERVEPPVVEERVPASVSKPRPHAPTMPTGSPGFETVRRGAPSLLNHRDPVVEERAPASVSKPPLAETVHDDAAPVRAFWQALGLPGLLDCHTHFLPPSIERAVYAVFDDAGPKIGRTWPIRYRESLEDRLAILRAMGVRRFPTLPYAHKPGVAGFLNGWARGFADEVPESLWSATFFPEPEAAAYVDDLVAAGVEVFKVHVQVGEFRLDDPLLDPVWATLADSATPVVIHAGSGPVGNAFTGPEPLRAVLQRFPRLVAVVAHLGAPEYDGFLTLADRFDRVHLDTTMVFTDFFDESAGAFPPRLLPPLRDLGDRVLLGSDFPTIPYPYATQLDGLARLDLGDDWLRAVCWENAAELFGGVA